MCTVILAQGVHPSHPLLIAANRDEFYARPASPPTRLTEDPKVFGGRDATGGGTWLGLTPDGFFACVTNHRAPQRKALRSRGQLVVDVLRAGSLEKACALLAGLVPSDYNGFNLLYGDAQGIRLAYGRIASLEVVDVPPGLHALHNDRLDAPIFAWKRARTLELARAALTDADPLAALHRALGDHALPPPELVPDPPPGTPFDRETARKLQALCIDTPLYGTRSSTVLALRPGGVERYLFGDGPAHASTLVDFTKLVVPSGESPAR